MSSEHVVEAGERPKRRFVIETFDDAIEAIAALEDFFSKVKKSQERFKRLIKTLGVEEERPRFSFRPGAKIEDEFMRYAVERVLEEAAKRRGLTPSREPELTEEEEKEIDKVVDEFEKRRAG